MCIFNRNCTTINNECLCFHNYLQEIYYQNLLMENHRRTQREWQHNSKCRYNVFSKSKLFCDLLQWIKSHKRGILMLWSFAVVLAPLLFLHVLPWVLGMENVLSR